MRGAFFGVDSGGRNDNTGPISPGSSGRGNDPRAFHDDFELCVSI